MKYLKLFNEKLGISQDMEEQVLGYMKEIIKMKDKKTFRFLYQSDLGNHFFTLNIDSSLDSLGNLITYGKYETGLRYTITLKKRKDEATLLHEVKHLDYSIRNKGKQSIYRTSKTALDGSSNKSNAIQYLSWFFYIFNDDEFQSKYQGLYKDFDIYFAKIVAGSDKETITRKLILGMFEVFLKDYDPLTFITYLTNKEIRFEDFMSKRELNKIILYYISSSEYKKIIENGETNSEFGLMYKYFKFNAEKILRTTFNKWTPEQEKEIEKFKKYFEKDINQKRHKYKKRLYRIVSLIYDKYHTS